MNSTTDATDFTDIRVIRAIRGCFRKFLIDRMFCIILRGLVNYSG